MKWCCRSIALLFLLNVVTAEAQADNEQRPSLFRRLVGSGIRRYLNLGLEDAENGQCETTYSSFVECMVMNFLDCNSGCILGNPGLTPGEDCGMLNDFYDSNKACCPPCEAELDNFKTCKSCDGDAVPDTTPDTTTTTQAPPPPDTTTTETDPPPPPDTTTQAPPPPDTNTVEATPSPTKSPTTSPTLTPLTESPTIGSTDSPTPKETALPPFDDSMSMSMSMDIPTSAPTNVPPTEAPKGEIMGVVFEDTNGNGVPDPGEPGLAGVVVIITDTFGFFQTVTTDGRGVYEAIVPAGPAVIDIVETSLPPGAQQTAGTDPTTVIVPAGGRATDLDGYFVPTDAPTRAPTTASPTDAPTRAPTTASPTETPTRAPTTASPTETPTGKIKGIVFEDINGNGAMDPNEPGLAGVVVIITDTFGFFQTVTTDGAGMYEAVVPAGPAVTDIVETSLPPGAQQTAGSDPTTVDVPAGGTATDLDGYNVPTDSPTSAPTVFPPTSPPTEVCIVPGCCVEDCCGPGTSWDNTIEFCVGNPSSGGWNGTYMEDYSYGCKARRCCEGACCGTGTEYDETIQCCLPF